MNFEKKVSEYINAGRLISHDDTVLVALSGGADSVCLLRVLMALDFRCVAMHCNFHLRGEESDRDQRFVEQLCGSLGVELLVTHFDTVGYASSNKVSIEMAARELRYDWFEQCRKKYSPAVIAVAHHKDDSVETFLLNLMRGTGINGLKGISPKNGFVVRPLLCVGRKEVTGYLDSLSQDYVTDSTNLESEYKRNKVRLELIPLMETINPSVKDAVMTTAEHLRQASEIYAKSVMESISRVMEGDRIYIPRLLEETSPQTVLFEILSQYGFNSRQVADIFGNLNGTSGRAYYSSSKKLLRDRDVLIISDLAETGDREQVYDFFNTVAYLPEAAISYAIEDYDKNYVIDKNSRYGYVDFDKLPDRCIYARRWREGDRFVPFGMRGSKKISDFLTDIKMNQNDKDNVFVVCSGSEIVWVAGLRGDNRYRVDASTRRVMKLTLSVHGNMSI